MQRNCAVLFDLDDTLYPLEAFVKSGFSAVATHIERTRGIGRRRVLRTLVQASEGAGHGRELQAVAAEFALPSDAVAEWVAVIRTHRPRLRLSRASSLTLRRLRRQWALAVVTNGAPDIQARKVAALRLGHRVDAVVYAAAHGTGRGKPERAPFWAALRQLGVPPERAVFVGDDERCDVLGASRVGMHTIFYAPRRHGRVSPSADAVVRSLLDVPRIAAALVGGRLRGMRHVA